MPLARRPRSPPKQVVILKGSANWDSAFDTLIDSFKTLSGLLDKQGIKPSDNPMIVYTSTDDTGFTYMAEIPVDQEPKNLAKGMSMGKSPDGKALKFVHRGSYDNMDNTYEAITNHLDERSSRPGHFHRGIHHRSPEDRRGQAGDQRLCAAEVSPMKRHTILAALVASALFTAPALAESDFQPSISVSGEATISAPPDQAEIEAGTTTDAKTARDAAEANNTAMAKVLSALKGRRH